MVVEALPTAGTRGFAARLGQTWPGLQQQGVNLHVRARQTLMAKREAIFAELDRIRRAREAKKQAAKAEKAGKGAAGMTGAGAGGLLGLAVGGPIGAVIGAGAGYGIGYGTASGGGSPGASMLEGVARAPQGAEAWQRYLSDGAGPEVPNPFLPGAQSADPWADIDFLREIAAAQ